MLLLTKSISTCAALACMLVGSLCADEHARFDVKDVDGLRIRLQLPAAESARKFPPRCELVLENVGASDLNVNLGLSLANGKFHHPTAIRLLALSKGKTTQTLIYSIRVAGRVDPFIVPLPVGSTYALRIAFDKFADVETGEPLDLTAKDYRITAELVGEPVAKEQGSNFQRELALMRFWQGNASSNEVQFQYTK